MRRRAASGFGVLVLGLALAIAPAVVTSPVGATTKHHKAAKHPKKKPAATTKVSTNACTAYGKEETQSSGIATAIEQAFASGNFASIKAAMLTEFSALDQNISKAEGDLKSAPANVQAAFNTIAAAFGQVKTAIQNATSLTQLGSSFSTFGSETNVIAADKVLASYFGTKCPPPVTTTTT